MQRYRQIIDLAIVIPTLNEERYIGRLIDSIIVQTVQPSELILVDAYSKDKTIEEIKKRQTKISLKYFQIPKHTIARQRNFGAAKTNSPHLLFLDADMEMKEKDVLERYFNEILKRKPDVAAAENLPDSATLKNTVYYKAENLLIKCIKDIWPVITARNLYVRRKMFNKVKGFEDGLAVGEDQELVQRIVKAGSKLIILKTVKLHTSARRVELEGRRKYALRMIKFGLSVMLFGRKKTKVKYEFGNFK